MNLTQFAHLPRRKKLAILRTIVENALLQYDIKIKSISFYAEHSNILYKVVDQQNDQYIIKVVRPGDMSYEELVAYLTWLDMMHQQNPRLPILLTKLTKNSHFVATVESPVVRHCCVFKWIPGVSLRSRVSRPNVFKWGKLLASIHNASEKCHVTAANKLRKWNKVFYWDKQVLFSDQYRSLMPTKRLSIYQKTAEKVEKAIQKLASPSIIIHGDLHLDNVKVHKGQLYALDFEDCMWGSPIQDISIALLYIRFRPNHTILFQKFKDGYDSVRNWPQSYPGEIETFFMGRLLMFANILIKVDHMEEDLDENIEARLQRYQEEFDNFLQTYH
ncbi:phosphotransferase enzyme family protein [Candidatus Uabimicrobium amorphum]|uniref:Aminoglycoside phosphotransferase n=1 Tax=Uabimicrobium amorphum TaxID=2596890 RepID=A0A5S9F4F3_UABAM|nr:phosphotransferase [Candidatus Uabimicrobium amorphum]BBM85747.1 aminoglycoside phosphotransferase [Candidatus Uabimicrobium amorphum]